MQFDDQRDSTGEVTACSDQLVDVAMETSVTHLRQKLSIPLSDVEVSEDLSHLLAIRIGR